MGKLTLKNDKFIRTKSDSNASIYTDKYKELEKTKVLSRVRNSKKSK